MPDGLAEINQKPYCQVEIDQTRDGLVEINQKPYCQVDIDQKPYSLVEIDRLAFLSSVTPPPPLEYRSNANLPRTAAITVWLETPWRWLYQL